MQVIGGECKHLLADPKVQLVLHNRWRVVLPSAVHEYARRHWLGQSTKSAKREIEPPSWWRLALNYAWTLLVNVVLIVGTAVFPPLGRWVTTKCEQAKQSASAAVTARND